MQLTCEDDSADCWMWLQTNCHHSCKYSPLADLLFYNFSAQTARRLRRIWWPRSWQRYYTEIPCCRWRTASDAVRRCNVRSLKSQHIMLATSLAQLRIPRGYRYDRARKSTVHSFLTYNNNRTDPTIYLPDGVSRYLYSSLYFNTNVCALYDCWLSPHLFLATTKLVAVYICHTAVRPCRPN